MSTLVLLSGGMDSAVCLWWAAEYCSPPIDAICFDYQQVAQSELTAASHVWQYAQQIHGHQKLRALTFVPINAGVFAGHASILGRSEINHYPTPEAAVIGTATDRSFLPMRNATFFAIAANHLLVRDPEGGTIVTGIRGRDPSAPVPGFPDCTRRFAAAMGRALTEGAGVEVIVIDPLNIYADSRSKTLHLAKQFKGCWEALSLTMSCYEGSNCGVCLPCVRRAQAFAEIGEADPALGGNHV